MLRGWKGIAVSVAIALALFAGAVTHALHRRPDPKGFTGLEFAPMTPATAARTPLLRGGARVGWVVTGSPADRAGIEPDDVVAAIDGKPVATARQAADMVAALKPGATVTLTLYDLAKGAFKPQMVRLLVENEPTEKKLYLVHPAPTLAHPPPSPPLVAANAAWSRKLLRGPTIRPLALTGLGAGQCNGFAPERWKLAGHARDNSLFHVMAEEGFAHAIYQSAALDGRDAETFLRDYLGHAFGAPAVLTPSQDLADGFVLRDFGNQKGGAGFVLYRVTGGRIALWLAAYAGGEAGWQRPLVGAVVLSMRCASPGAPAPVPRDAHLLATRVSLKCLRGQCEEGDFAGNAYLPVLRFGYVHNAKGDNFLVRPRRDYWQNGAEGPGFYHQTGGENERLYPGRTN